MNKLLDIISTLLMFAVSICAIVMVVIDTFGGRATTSYMRLIVVMLSLLGLYLSSSFLRREHVCRDFARFRKATADDFERVIVSLGGVDVKVFASSCEAERYLARRIREAQKDVCDLSWTDRYSPYASLSQRKKSNAAYERSIDIASERVIYREIFVFSEEGRKEKLRRRLAQSAAGYSCRYFEGAISIPRIQFAMIDREEVVFDSPWDAGKHYAIKHAALIDVLGAYFEKAWEKAVPLVEGKQVHHERLRRVLVDGLSDVDVRQV